MAFQVEQEENKINKKVTGWDLNLFLDQGTAKKYLCGICKCVAKDGFTVLCKSNINQRERNAHLFCDGCLKSNSDSEDSKKCVLDENHSIVLCSEATDKRFLIDSFPVCCFKSQEFHQNMSLEENEGNHGLLMVTNNYIDDERSHKQYCGWKGQLNELHAHFNNECQFKHKKCIFEHCQYAASNMDINLHLTTNLSEHFRIIINELNQLKDENIELRQKMVEIQHTNHILTESMNELKNQNKNQNESKNDKDDKEKRCEIFGVGSNDNYKLGINNNQTSIDELIRLDWLFTKYDKIINFYAMYEHNVIVTASNKIFVFGLNSKGNLGLKHDTKHIPTPTNHTFYERILKNKNNEVLFVSNGWGYHTIIGIKDSKHSKQYIYGHGYNDSGQLGISNDSKYMNIPTLLSFGKIVINDCKIGMSHTLFLTDNGMVYGVGSNYYGQCGFESRKLCNTPTPIKSLIKHRMRAISAGFSHSLFLSEIGKLFVCGRNNYYQCASQQTLVTAPIIIPYFATRHTIIKTIVAAPYHNAVIDSYGNLYLWGYNSTGQIGDGTTKHCKLPVIISHLIQQNETVKDVKCGSSHTIAICHSNNIYGWGNNKFGQAVFSGTSTILTPTLIQSMNAENIKDIVTGRRFTVLIKK